MIRVSNRYQNTLEQQLSMGPQVQFIERVVEVPVPSEPQIIEVPFERIVEVEKHVPAPANLTTVDLTPIKKWCEHRIDEQNVAHALKLQDHKEWNNQRFDSVKTALDMQSRALVGLKMQRDVDRKRRLSFIRRIKKEQDKARKRELKLKLAIGASLLLSIVSLIVKL